MLFFGSVQRGTPAATSDVDLYIVTSGTEWWREGRIREGVEIELFFAPPVDRSGVGAELAALGRRLWEAGPRALTDWEVSARRYRLADLADAYYAGGMDAAQAVAIAERALAPFGGRLHEYQSDRTAI